MEEHSPGEEHRDTPWEQGYSSRIDVKERGLVRNGEEKERLAKEESRGNSEESLLVRYCEEADTGSSVRSSQMAC